MPSAARRDPLTGLDGPDEARARLASWRDAASHDGREAPVQAMLIGLRRFDTVNLAYGAETGDAALVEVATRMLHFAASEVDGEWLVARLGGGTFLFAACEASSRERWHSLAEALSATIAEPLGATAGGAGVSLWPRVALMRSRSAVDSDRMLEALVQTLDRLSQQEGRRIEWVDGRNVHDARTTTQLEGDLIGGLERGEISVLFQPQFACRDNRVIGAEALARWEHPQLGRLGAGALFGIAQRVDQTAQLSRHVVQEALRLASAWHPGLRLSLNVTPADLATAEYAAKLLDMVSEAGIPPPRITLEITEQTLLGDIDRAARLLARLSGAGFSIALDDFGAGFCNFHYLKVLPLDYLKLDRMMVEGIAHDRRDLAVFRGIVGMARALDLKLIVEGIESEEQRGVVVAEGCDFYQGFIAGKPMEAEEFIEFSEN